MNGKKPGVWVLYLRSEVWMLYFTSDVWMLYLRSELWMFYLNDVYQLFINYGSEVSVLYFKNESVVNL